MPKKRTTDAIFALIMLIEIYRESQRELHYVLVDFEKAYDSTKRGAMVMNEEV